MKCCKHLMSVTLGLLLGFSYNATAAVIQQIKGNRVLIQLEGLQAPVGTELFALNTQQKRRALIRISAVRDDRAIGMIVKGNVQAGMTLVAKATPPPTSPSFSSRGGLSQSTAREEAAILARRYKRGLGVIAGFATNTASINARTSVSGVITEQALAMKGNAYNLKAIYDYHMSPSFTIRTSGGVESLFVNSGVASGKEILCSGTSTCVLALNYISMEASGQFNLTSGQTRFWVGAGAAFLLAMSKNNNITNLDSTSTNQVLFASLGVDISVGRTGYIPIVAEYGLFPLAGIPLSGMYLRAGYGWKY